MRIAEGWLAVVHGVDPTDSPGQLRCCPGILVHHAEHLDRILYRSNEPLFVPQTPGELPGTVGNVDFPTGIDRRGERIFDVYYGMADYEIGRGRLTFERSTDNEGRMIELLQGFPDNVVACAAKGQVTKKDYEQALIPDVERALERNAKIRCYYELSPEFAGFDAGAAWEDAKLGIEHLTRWERVAVVTDVEWIRLATSAFRFLMPGQVRVFSAADSAEAKRWITAA